jgi:hypothetical protein
MTAYSLPYVSTLDRFDGPLPPGAFGIQGPPETDPKRTCRLALRVAAVTMILE